MSNLSSKSTVPANTLNSRWDLYALLFVRLPKLYRPVDALLHLVLLSAMLVSTLVLFINHYVYHYSVLTVPHDVLMAAPGVIIVWILGTLLQPRLNRIGLFLSSFAQMYFYLIIGTIAVTAILTTPNKIIDYHLLDFDSYLGFSTTKTLAWVYQHPVLLKGLKYAYDSLYIELLLTPLFLALCNNRREIDRYVLATFVGLIIAAIIYYFWPTIAPAGIVKSHYFMFSQYNLVQRFYEIHQGQPITVFAGGVIGFPSTHVMGALIILFAWRSYPWVFYPLLFIAVFLIFATLGLGYHYLIDVIAGALLAYLSIKLSTRLIK